MQVRINPILKHNSGVNKELLNKTIQMPLLSQKQFSHTRTNKPITQTTKRQNEILAPDLHSAPCCLGPTMCDIPVKKLWPNKLHPSDQTRGTEINFIATKRPINQLTPAVFWLSLLLCLYVNLNLNQLKSTSVYGCFHKSRFLCFYNIIFTNIQHVSANYLIFHCHLKKKHTVSGWPVQLI